MEDLGSILPKALKRHLCCPTPRVLEVLGPLWTRIVGKLIAQHSTPARFAGGTLVISAYSPPWAAQLSQMAEQIRAEINDFLAAPVVRKIRVRYQPVSKPIAPVDARPAKLPMMKGLTLPPDAVRRLLWADGRPTLDAELAAVVERSFIKYFSRNEKGLDA
jgi:predicted nucleic acid-binding Zn ribbon protein